MNNYPIYDDNFGLDFTSKENPLNIIKSANKRVKPHQRKQQILRSLIDLLTEPNVDKISIAVVAKKINISEAIVYRHFSNKTALFLSLIEIIEDHIFTNINRIETDYDDGLELVNQTIIMLLQFSQNNPGLTRILTNEALFCEEKNLLVRMQQLVDRIEASLRQAYRIAGAQEVITKGREAARANFVLCYVMGCWQRFARSGFQKLPLDMWENQKDLLV